MMSSSSAIALVPAHPETTENEPAAVDHRHPHQETETGNEEIADQRQRGDAKADRDKSITEPQACDAVDQHEIDRPERTHLARPKMAEHRAAQQTEGEEQHKGDSHPDIEAASGGSWNLKHA